MQIINCELYTNNFEGTKFKINYIWGYEKNKFEYHCCSV
jgi:hypothetical protein